MEIRSLLKPVPIIVLAFLGAFAGVYLGKRLILSERIPISARYRAEFPEPTAETKLHLNIGDDIPDLAFRDSLGSGFFSSEFAGNQRSIIIFSSLVCGECPIFIKQWDRVVAPWLKDDIKVYLLLPNDESHFTVQERKLFEGKELLFYDDSVLDEPIRLRALPTVIFLYPGSRVFDISYGFSHFYHREMIEEFTNWEFEE